MWLYSFLLILVLVLGTPYWLFRMATSGRYRAGLAGRLGLVPPGFQEQVAALRVERRGGGGVRPLMWVHAVSVGEVLAAARLIDEFKTGDFQRAWPGMVFAVSTTTEAGKKLADERLSGCAIFYFPLDLKFAMRPYLELLAPQVVVLIESELWPRMISECSKLGVPVVVANARVSDRSFPRYMRLKSLWRPMLEKIAMFLAQSDESASRLREIGAPRVEVMGNIKYDARAGKETPLVTAMRSRMQPDSVVVVCGSTLAGEESMILAAWPAVLQAMPRAVLVIAPRHPDRFDEVAELVKKSGMPLIQASGFLQSKVTIRSGNIFLIDTIGDLAGVYGLAEVAFVGGSLVNAGGHNPLEPAHFGVPVVMGPSFENFREIVEAMKKTEGIRIVTRESLSDALVGMVRNRDIAKAMGARGRAVSAAHSGASARTATALLKLLPARTATRDGATR